MNRDTREAPYRRARTERAINELAEGRIIVITDDESRENEGDLAMCAAFATPEAINFMVTEGRGLVCVPMGQGRAEELGLRQMERDNTDPHGTAFTVSVDHVGTGTGISASDRALTIQRLAAPSSKPADFRRPGHVFPLAARPRGVLERRGHTEASLDLAAAALPDERHPAAVICEILNPDGSMARGDDVRAFAARHGLAVVSIDEIVAWKRASMSAVRLVASSSLPTAYGTFAIRAYQDGLSGLEHVALTMGEVSDGRPVLARIHSECLTGDALGSKRCDCGEQYEEAMRRIAQAGRGALVYLRQEGRGIGLANKIRAYSLQDGGLDTVEANLALGFRPDERDYAAAGAILRDLSISSVDLMTNNPDKVAELTRYGISVHARIPIKIESNPHNERYLRTKAERMGHQCVL